MATATAAKPVKAKSGAPAGFRIIRGKQVPVGVRRPIAALIKAAEDKLADFDDKYQVGRQKLMDKLEAVKTRHSKTAVGLELIKDKTAAEAMAENDRLLAQLLANRRALKTIDPSLKRDGSKSKKAKK